MSKEAFKIFAKNNPNLIQYVNKGEISWQKLYEMYNLYGENSDVWAKYLKPIDTIADISRVTPTNELAFKELFNMVKNIDLEKVRQGIEGVQKTISLVQDLGFGSNKTNIKEEYQGRPLYQHFED